MVTWQVTWKQRVSSGPAVDVLPEVPLDVVHILEHLGARTDLGAPSFESSRVGGSPSFSPD